MYKFIQKTIKQSDLPYLLIGLIVIILALSPFWMFGSFSALGWYDELDGTMPWYFAKNQLHDAYGFLHGYSGGTGGPFGFLCGNEKISFYRFLINHFTPWVAGFLIRFLAMTFWFTGVYTFVRKMFHETRFFALAAGLFSVLVNYIPFGWTIGGLVWDFGIVTWLSVLFFTEFKKEYIRYLLAIAIFFIAATTSTFVFLLPFAFYLFLFNLILFYTDKISKKTIVTWILLGSVFFIALVANWLDGIKAILHANEFSARIRGTLSLYNLPDNISLYQQIIQLIQQDCTVLYYFFARNPTSLLGVIYLLIFVIAWRVRAISKAGLFLVFSFFLPSILDVGFRFSGLHFAAQYRWNILWQLQSIMSVFFLSYLNYQQRLLVIKRKLSDWNKYEAIMLIFFAIVGAYQLMTATFREMAATGGFGIMSSYSNLVELKESRNHYRFISTGGISAAIPLFYNLDTFDGMVHNYPFRRSYFVAYGVYSPSIDRLHTHRHAFYTFPKGLDVAMFKMANVGYVVSDKPMNISDLKLISSSSAIYSSEIHYLLKSIINKSRRLVPSLYVYQLKGVVWPRIFVASSVQWSGYSFQDKNFYQQLKKIPYQTILVAKEDAVANKLVFKSNKSLKIKKYELGEKTVNISLEGEGGVVVFNQVITPGWKAFCATKELAIVPANGIMMAVLAPKSCKELIFEYQGNR